MGHNVFHGYVSQYGNSYNEFMLTTHIFTDFVILTDARVYCQDSNATPFIFLGFSCPVNCNNIMQAVKRLKLLDEQGVRTEYTIKYINRRFSYEETRGLFLTCERIFNNKMATEEVQEELQQYHKCRLFQNKGFSMKMELNMTKCYRRSNQRNFLMIFTKILNKHAHGMYKFTEDMAALILDKIIGEQEALRNNKLDIKKILQFLKKALTIHKTVAHAEQITLQSKHCLMLNLPGCYCKTGFVENSGQCVKPTDCLTDTEYLKYMPRVHLL